MRGMRRNIVSVADYPAAQEFFFEHSLTDGLPVVPPTADLVDAMMRAGGLPGDTVLGVIESRPEGLTVEQAAACAVMAGARPSYFPVVLATWAAVFDQRLNGGATLGSSGGTALTAIVSGPYAARIGMNSGHNLFGPGNRANATIGRAVRLGLMNGLGYRPGHLDGSSFGSQARYTAHFAESSPVAPWEALNVRLGYSPESTTVTVAVTDAPRQVSHFLTGEDDRVLAALAACMRDPSHFPGYGSVFIVVLGPEHAEILRAAGWSQRAICEHLAERTRLSPSEVEAAGVPLDDRTWEWIREHGFGRDGKLPVTHPDLLTLVTAGGTGAGWSHVIFGYAPSTVFTAVTKEVVVP
jgi:hypothetical protein